MHAMCWPELLTKERDIGVSENSGVKGILAFPRCEGCMGTEWGRDRDGTTRMYQGNLRMAREFNIHTVHRETATEAN